MISHIKRATLNQITKTVSFESEFLSHMLFQMTRGCVLKEKMPNFKDNCDFFTKWLTAFLKIMFPNHYV